MDFNELKRSRKNSLADLQNDLEKISGKKKSRDAYKDDRFWEPTVSKEGNGSAILRFLPDPNNEKFSKIFSHGFKGPTGRWYIESCLSTINQPDPCLEYTKPFWDRGEGDLVRHMNRRTHFISNVHVIKDPGDPTNEGKVFLYKFGIKIFNKIEATAFPPVDDEGRTKTEPGYKPSNAFDVFDMTEGANFRLLIQNVEKQRNYDASKFDSQSAWCGGDEVKQEELWKQTHSVADIVAPDKFKSYGDLKAHLYTVLGVENLESTHSPNSDAAFIEKNLASKSEAAPAPKKELVADDDDIDLDKLMDELGD